MVIVFGALGDADGGEAGAQHLDLVAAATETVGAVYHLDVEIGQVAVGDAVDEPGQVA